MEEACLYSDESNLFQTINGGISILLSDIFQNTLSKVCILFFYYSDFCLPGFRSKNISDFKYIFSVCIPYIHSLLTLVHSTAPVFEWMNQLVNSDKSAHEELQSCRNCRGDRRKQESVGRWTCQARSKANMFTPFPAFKLDTLFNLSFLFEEEFFRVIYFTDLKIHVLWVNFLFCWPTNLRHKEWLELRNFLKTFMN